MSDQTILSLINEIERTAIRKKSSDSEKTKTKWTKQDEDLIFEVNLFL